MPAIFMGHLYLKNFSGSKLNVSVFDRRGHFSPQGVDPGNDTTVHFEAEEDNGIIPLPDPDYTNRVIVHVAATSACIFDRNVHFLINSAHHTVMVAADDPVKPGAFLVHVIGQ